MTRSEKRTAAIVGGLVALGVGLVAWLWPRGAGASSSQGGAFIPRSEVQEMLLDLFEGSAIPTWFAYACAELESRFNPRAYNPERAAGAPQDEGSFGLFQIYWHAHREALESQGISREDLYDPRVNAVYWRALCERLAGQVGATKDDAPSWERVRLRLAGDRDGVPDDASDQARITRYRPVAAKWQGQL